MPNSKKRVTIPGVELEKLIGKGGMGRVYLGTQTYLGRKVAVKIIAPDPKSPNKDLDQRFRREAKIMAGFSQPNIVSCYDGGTTENGLFFIIMEFIDGPDLGRLIVEKGPLSEAVSLGIIRDLAQALGHALEKGIIHRDVKAENILLKHVEQSGSMTGPPTKPDFPFQIKLADLGLARFQEQSDPRDQLTQQGVIFGTPQIMAPEQFQDNQAIDFKVDLYALGCLLYRCLYGRPPFDSGSFSAIVAKKVLGELPDLQEEQRKFQPETLALIKHLMAFKPEERPASYQEVIEICDRLLHSVSRAQPQPRRTTGMIPLHGQTETIALDTRPPGNARPGKLFRNVILPVTFLMVLVAGIWGWNLYRTKDLPAHSASTAEEQSQTSPEPGPVELFPLVDVTEPLFHDDFFTRLDGWNKTGSWGPEEDGPGVIAIAGESSALLIRPDSPDYGAWTGTILFQSTFEVGVGLQIGEESTILLRIQNLGSQLLCTISQLTTSEDGIAALTPTDVEPVTMPFEDTHQPISFRVERNADFIAFQVDGMDAGKWQTENPAQAFILLAQRGVAIFRDVALQNTRTETL